MTGRILPDLRFAAPQSAVTPYKPPGRNSRFRSKPAHGRRGRQIEASHPAVVEGRTVYAASVRHEAEQMHVLIEGKNSWKIGNQIEKGRWKGFPVFTLTLEERATCPRSCALWVDCYGNQMHWAQRIEANAAFEDRLGLELGVLQHRFPGGFAVRVHILGDFYSVGYVHLWREWLDLYPALHVFGFSARHEGRTDPIARALIRLVDERWERFAVRFSNAPHPEYTTVTIEHADEKPADAIQCPQQTGRTENCGTCGLCWQTTRRIAFIVH